MTSKSQAKPKRHKKRKSRTQVSSDSDSEYEKEVEKSPSPPPQETKAPPPKKSLTDAEISTAFTQYYMQRATTEFAEDLDRIRTASDFKDDALPILIHALQQGTEMFSPEEQRRIILAGEGKDVKMTG
ncbi:hypothetical protein G7Y89_g5453 [Cudoniella acicularis]|uniref:Ribosome assembly protein 3 n=1 Tax=Cudoniella acicularis TaxID=354080 RepID=A0A8H4RMF7_9HELO|nr:hypothetical protein G7Y89_g5453 [Cudoniella acicularis]